MPPQWLCLSLTPDKGQFPSAMEVEGLSKDTQHPEGVSHGVRIHLNDLKEI
jgi:hypothetical protein